MPTSPIRSALEFFLMYCGRSPPGIQFEMSWKGVTVMPNKGKMFGCAKRFHITASLQKAYGFR